MFSLEKEIGQHKIYTYSVKDHNFLQYLKDLYSNETLESLHILDEDYNKFLNNECEGLENKETNLHKIFYNDIKTNPTFKKLYVGLVKDIYTHFFPNEPALIYQSFPSIRFQFPNNISVPPHCDSDDLGRHPLGEQNFLLPMTKMTGTTRLFIETEPKKGDYMGIDLNVGDIFYFNGNTCVHMNQSNKENYLRVSFDFRVLTPKDYMNYIMNTSVTNTNPRDVDKTRKSIKMVVGGYYQAMFKGTSVEENTQWHSIREPIVQTRPVFGEEETNACISYLQTGEPFITEFRKTTELESMLKSYIGVNQCYMTTSGTTAIMTALLALDLPRNSDVIVPNYTMIATANAVRALGLNPIFIDVHPETFTIDLASVKKHRTPQTKAVIHVTLNNRSYDLHQLAEYCKSTGLYLIEDAAQSLGCFLNKQHYGTIGDIGCFSLSTPKIISTGQGGFVVTNNKILGDKMFKIKNFGRKSGGVEEYEEFGLNFKLTDIQSVIGIEQMKKVPARVVRMKEIYTQYKNGLGVSNSYTLLSDNDNPEWIPWFVDILVKDRTNLMKFLKQHQIDTRVCYPSIVDTEVYRNWQETSDREFPNSQTISETGLFLPTHFRLTDEEIRYICLIIRMFYKVDKE